MADKTKIEWTRSADGSPGATWNPITGCTLVSEGCRHCYAASLAATRLKNHPSRQRLARINAAGEAKFTGEVRFNAEWLDQPLRWKRPRMIFTVAHGDLFHESVPDEWIDRVFAVMALAPQHTFQVLTKRPEQMRRYLTHWPDGAARFHHVAYEARKIRPGLARGFPDGFTWDLQKRWPLPNVWAGTSCEDQATADERIPHLLATPAAVRFVSLEPLLGPIDLYNGDPDPRLGGHRATHTFIGSWWERDDPYPGPSRRGVNWVIVGGESGPGARPMHLDWVRSLRDQCQAAEVAFHFKQWGQWVPISGAGLDLDSYRASASTYVGTVPNNVLMLRVGKKRAGRMLDGRTWDEMPA